ncbi:MAG: hypothetical protein HY881_03940 [Deltaproteobacteria bacterium]|nr:hypothetical protein [Deltaproteobacteria bacterium]
MRAGMTVNLTIHPIDEVVKNHKLGWQRSGIPPVQDQDWQSMSMRRT